MYVTGGIGSRWEGEAFGEDYELPNDRAYAETCAAIGSVMWNWRMLQVDGEARFADLMENALYNGVLAGLSLDGEPYFYQNPLADAASHRRQPWFGCACCPPNIARLLASLPGYFYSTSEKAVWAHLYAAGQRHASDDGGRARSVTLTQETRYPWEGNVEIAVERPRARRLPFTFSCASRLVRAGRARGQRGGSSARRGRGVPGGAAGVADGRRRAALDLPMPARRIESHPHVANNHGRVALARGPLVYCTGPAGHGGPGSARPHAFAASSEVSARNGEPDLLGGVVALRAQGAAWGNLPRQPGRRHCPRGPANRALASGAMEVIAIPYYAWANREPGGMAVWILRE